MGARHLMECASAGIPVHDGKIQTHAYQRDRHSGAGNCICARHRGHLIHGDAELAKHTGGMIALYPRADYAEQLALPNGEPVKDLHMTLVFLGEVEPFQDDAPDPLMQSLANLAASYTVIDVPVKGYTVFDEGAVVYLLGDNPQLPDLHEDVLNAAHTHYNIPEQYNPWRPHVTVGYDINPHQLDFKGKIIFDRIGLALRERVKFLPLLGANIPEYEQ